MHKWPAEPEDCPLLAMQQGIGNVPFTAPSHSLKPLGNLPEASDSTMCAAPLRLLLRSLLCYLYIVEPQCSVVLPQPLGVGSLRHGASADRSPEALSG